MTGKKMPNAQKKKKKKRRPKSLICEELRQGSGSGESKTAVGAPTA